VSDSTYIDGYKGDIKFRLPDGTTISLKELISEINTLKIKVSHLENAYMEEKLMGKADANVKE
jgi:hypothetical protein